MFIVRGKARRIAFRNLITVDEVNMAFGQTFMIDIFPRALP